MGAAAGAALGGLTAYYQTQVRKYPDPRARRNAILRDIGSELTLAEAAQAAYDDLADCRTRQLQELKAAAEAKRISAAAAREQLNAIRSKQREEAEVVREIGQNIDEREDRYSDAARAEGGEVAAALNELGRERSELGRNVQRREEEISKMIDDVEAAIL